MIINYFITNLWISFLIVNKNELFAKKILFLIIKMTFPEMLPTFPPNSNAVESYCKHVINLR